MIGYWKRIRATAWRETLEVLRFDQPARVLLWLAVLAAPTLVAIGTSPTWRDASWRALAVIGATCLVALGVYCFKLIKIPARAGDLPPDVIPVDQSTLFKGRIPVAKLGKVSRPDVSTLLVDRLELVGADLSKNDEYRLSNLKLRFKGASAEGHVSFGVQTTNTLMNVSLEIVGEYPVFVRLNDAT